MTIAKVQLDTIWQSLHKMHVETCIIWEKKTTGNSPDVAEEFKLYYLKSSLYWIDKCGHAAMMEQPWKNQSFT
jgi:pimeloyl-ACP methyl ester carboxylesterase